MPRYVTLLLRGRITKRFGTAFGRLSKNYKFNYTHMIDFLLDEDEMNNDGMGGDDAGMSTEENDEEENNDEMVSE